MKKVMILLPAYNEEEQIETSVKKLHNYCINNLNEYDWNIIIGDNNSKDNTLKKAKKLSKKFKRVNYIHLNQKGRGRIIMKSWGESDADICIYMDMDLSTDLKHIKSLIKAIDKKDFDIAIGSRNLINSEVKKRGLKRTLFSKAYIFLIKLIHKVAFTDSNCGFKAASRKSINLIFPLIQPHYWDKGNSNGSAWFWDVEFLIIADKIGLSIFEEGVKWTDDPGTTVNIIRDSKEHFRGILRLKKNRPWERFKRNALT
jgi:glycosyltransferase involved in cell wall biosynthesis